MSAAAAKIGLLFGADTERALRADIVLECSGNNDISRLLIAAGFRTTNVQLTPNYMKRTGPRWRPSQFDLVINQISDPDFNPKVLTAARTLCERESVPVINAPAAIFGTTRDEVASRLAGIPGLTVPKTIRVRNADAARAEAAISDNELTYPLIVRLTGTHTGETAERIDRPEGLRAYAFAKRRDVYITEFFDARESDGLYRKWRLYFIGGIVVPRHVMASDHWSVHAAARKGFMVARPELVRQEQTVIANFGTKLPNAILNAFTEIQKRINLDYFGLDCVILRDGRFIVFECNATMNFFPLITGPEYLHLRDQETQAIIALRKLVADKIKPAAARV